MNWLYDHLRQVPRYSPIVMTNVLQNRDEFPDLQAFDVPWGRLGARVWRRAMGSRPYPPDIKRAKSFRPVLLHSHFGYVAVEDIPLQQALSLPWIVSFYGVDVYSQGRDAKWLDRYGKVFERARLILALGPTMRDALVELGCARDKIQVHPLGVDVTSVPHASRFLESGAPLEILFAGTFREKKGITYLLEAAGLIKGRGVRFRLHLVGDAAGREGDDAVRTEVEGTIARHELDSFVTRYSWLEFNALIGLGLRCHVFVAPSVRAADGDSEGTPFVIQQMMLSGMPVISTVHSDIPYLFGPLAGSLVPERDAAAIAERLAEYAESPSLLAFDGARARARMLDAFDVRQCAARLANLYDLAIQ